MSTSNLPHPIATESLTTTDGAPPGEWSDSAGARRRSSSVGTAVRAPADVLSTGTDTESVEQGAEVDVAASSPVVEIEDRSRTTRLRRATRAVPGDCNLPVVLLSVVSMWGSVGEGDLVQQGAGVPVVRALFDFYDAGMLGRDGGAVQLTSMGQRVLERFSAA